MEIESPVVHKRMPHDVYIGRPSIWGNPYSHRVGTQAKFVVATREEAIEKYEVYIRSTPELLSRLPELQGKRLGCWCAPFPCHGDVLVKLLAEREAGMLVIPSSSSDPNPAMKELERSLRDDDDFGKYTFR